MSCQECKDYKESLELVVADDTAKDEVHCGCCVMLRVEAKRLRVTLKRMNMLTIYFAVLWGATFLAWMYFDK